MADLDSNLPTKNLPALEQLKFTTGPDGKVVVRTTSAPSLLPPGMVYDYVGITRPNDHTEVCVFKNGGSTGSLLATITIVYLDSTKDDIVSVTRT